MISTLSFLLLETFSNPQLRSKAERKHSRLVYGQIISPRNNFKKIKEKSGKGSLNNQSETNLSSRPNEHVKKYVYVSFLDLSAEMFPSSKGCCNRVERKERVDEEVENESKKGGGRREGEKKRTSARVVLIIATGVITCNYREKLPQRSMNAV